MSDRPKVEVVFIHPEDGDWIGMYVNGKLIQQGHSISEHDVALACGCEVTSSWIWDADEDGGRCPTSLADVHWRNLDA